MVPSNSSNNYGPINPLSNNNFLDWSRLKAFADDIINMNEKLKFCLEKVENIVEEEKMLVTSNVFKGLSHNVFKRLSPKGYQKLGLCGKELRRYCSV